MSTVIGQRELRNDSGAIMRRVEQGEVFVVTRNGVPVADLSPHAPPLDARRRFVPVSDIEAGFAALPPWQAARFADELIELDGLTADDEADPWSSRT